MFKKRGKKGLELNETLAIIILTIIIATAFLIIALKKAGII